MVLERAGPGVPMGATIMNMVALVASSAQVTLLAEGASGKEPEALGLEGQEHAELLALHQRGPTSPG